MSIAFLTPLMGQRPWRFGPAILAIAMSLLSTTVEADQGTVTKWLQRPFAPELVDPTEPMTEMQGENIWSDVDWRDIMTPDPQLPNWVVADDFRSDGRPILTVRWWGSYSDPVFEPEPITHPDGTTMFVPTTEDGFLLSFFSDMPADPSGAPSRPKDLLGSYIAPIPDVKINPTPWIGWDQHRIWQYEVNLQDTHLDHPSDIATPISFNEMEGVIYWLSVVAENGHEILPDWTSQDTGDDPITFHWWGWHTSPDQFNDAASMGSLFMPLDDWEYRDWNPIDPQHGSFDMAFELLTVPEPASAWLLIMASVAVWARHRAH